MIPRAELERQVDELHDAHTGAAFADAMRALHDSLSGSDREVLKAIVLERAANFDQALMERVDSRGWLRRQLDRASGGR